MLDFDSFQGNVPAHFLYALGLPRASREAILNARLRDGSWAEDASGCLNLVSQLSADEQDPEGAKWFVEFARTIQDRPSGIELGEAEHCVLPTLYYELSRRDGGSHELRRLTLWFVEASGPGDASLAADMLERAITPAPPGR